MHHLTKRVLWVGRGVEIELGDELQTWYYPTPADCGTCHNQAETGSLGANARQLNHDILYPTTGRVANQIQTLNHLSMFREKLTDEERLQVYNNVNSKDSSQALTLRVQSYLDANCAYCHRPNSGNRALFDATMNEDIYDQYLIDGDIINASLAGCTKLIRPGDVAQSIIHQRMNSLEEGVAMPPLAKNKIDEHGVALLEAWIKSLPVESSAQNSVDWENMFENNQFKQVSTGWDCSVWAIDQADQVWYFNEEQWERSDQQFSMIAAGTADDTYGLDLNGQIVHWDGQRWTRTIDQSVYNELSVGKDGSLWAIDWEGKLYERRGNEWIERAGGTLHIAVLDSQNAWRMAGDNNLIHWNGTEWRFVGYRYRQFRQIAYGDGEKLMAIDKGFDIYEYVDQSWRKAQGQFKQLSIGAGGVVWGISQQDSIYRGVSLEWTSLGREALELVKVSGDTLGQVWALDAQQKLWAFNSNNTWEESPFVFAQISSTANGQLWGLQPNGQVYQQTANSTWNEVETPVTFQQIYAGLGKDLWAIDSTQNLWRLSADLWQQEVGQLQDIAIGGSDRIFGIDLNGHIQHYSDGQWLLWDDAFNFSKLAVGKDIFWAITNEGFLYERKAACWVRRPETALDLSAWTNQQVYMADALGRINKWAPGNLDCSNTLEKESFAANGIGFEYTAISWTTYIDQLISSYEVQRSAINSNFETIHRQDALFGDRVKRDYAWNDQAPMEGDNYYRLAYLRSDGEIGYSPVVRVFYPKEDQTLLVYPNPFTSRIELNLQAFTGAAFELRIHDMAGRRLLLQEYPADHLGDIRLDLSNLASGIYLLQIWSPDLDKKISEKIIRH
ncbi:MAG: tectonin domain-containing protein [Bacteroidota bacterium]